MKLYDLLAVQRRARKPHLVCRGGQWLCRGPRSMGFGRTWRDAYFDMNHRAMQLRWP